MSLISRPRPIEDPDPPWTLHVSAKAGESTALCGAFVLTHCDPPKAVELGRRRPDGSEIQIAEVELEAGWIATVPRHPEHGTVGDLCMTCMGKVELLRWPGRASKEKLSAARVKAKAAREGQRKELAAKAKAVRDRLAQVKAAASKASGAARLHTKARASTRSSAWGDQLADEYGDE